MGSRRDLRRRGTWVQLTVADVVVPVTQPTAQNPCLHQPGAQRPGHQHRRGEPQGGRSSSGQEPEPLPQLFIATDVGLEPDQHQDREHTGHQVVAAANQCPGQRHGQQRTTLAIQHTEPRRAHRMRHRDPHPGRPHDGHRLHEAGRGGRIAGPAPMTLRRTSQRNTTGNTDNPPQRDRPGRKKRQRRHVGHPRQLPKTIVGGTVRDG